MANDGKPFHNPFGALSHLRGAPEADDPVAPTTVSTTVPPAPPSRRVVARAVVRMERAGRGGKEVTVVEQLGLAAPELAAWLQALKSALGCGGAVEADTLILQGDQRKRVPALLSTRGVKRVTVA